MLQHQFRLPPYERLLDTNTIKNRFFILKLSQNSLGHNRYGFVVTKTISRSAVDRNKIKRRIRACIEELHPSLKGDHDMLFIVRKDALAVTRGALYDTIHNIFQKLNLL